MSVDGIITTICLSAQPLNSRFEPNTIRNSFYVITVFKEQIFLKMSNVILGVTVS